MTNILDPHARRIADQVLAEEEGKRTHLVVALSGAHAYGFPSPDSDLDLKAIHIAPTRSLLGLSEPPITSDRLGVVEGAVCVKKEVALLISLSRSALRFRIKSDSLLTG